MAAHQKEGLYISPKSIRFSQNSISMQFNNEALHNNETLHDIIQKIEDDEMCWSDLPYIEVLERDGTYTSLDNRRLYVFRVLSYMGLLDSIYVKLIKKSKANHTHFTSDNDGCHVKVRGCCPYRHCECNYAEIYSDWRDNKRNYSDAAMSQSYLSQFDDSNYRYEGSSGINQIVRRSPSSAEEVDTDNTARNVALGVGAAAGIAAIGYGMYKAFSEPEPRRRSNSQSEQDKGNDDCVVQ